MTIQIGNKDLGALDTLSAKAAGTYTLGPFTNQQAKGIKVILDLTAGTGTVLVNINGIDPASGKSYAILSSTAKSNGSTTVLTVYPSITVAANVSASDHLPLNFNVTYTVATAAMTGTIGACLLD